MIFAIIQLTYFYLMKSITFSTSKFFHTDRIFNSRMKSSKSSLFGVEISSFEFSSKGALTTYPVASVFTSARYPDTFLRLDPSLKN